MPPFKEKIDAKTITTEEIMKELESTKSFHEKVEF